MKIGVFDSGFGGIDILRHIIEKLPDHDYVYLGDSARNPYGFKSQETLSQYAKEAVDFLFSKNCQLVIFACNTASAQALRVVQTEHIPGRYDGRNALGVIVPSAEAAAYFGDTVGVIATESTVASQTFAKEIKKLKPSAHVFQQACPLLVKLVETGEDDQEILDRVLKRYLQPLVDKKIDTLILGCTHYGLLRDQIEDVLRKLGSNAKIIHQGEIVAQKFAWYLNKHPEYQLRLSKNRTREFYATDITRRFKELGSEYFGEEIDPKQAIL